MDDVDVARIVRGFFFSLFIVDIISLFNFFLDKQKMLKFLGTNKKKNSTRLKPGQLKIPIPMVNGIEYTDMSDSQIQNIISHAALNKKSQTPSLASSQKSTKSSVSHITPVRSTSSPPILVMPKPKHRLPPTLNILRNTEHEKTQVDSSSSSSSSDHDDKLYMKSKDNEDILEKQNEKSSHKLSFDSKNIESSSSNGNTRKSNDSNRSFISATDSPFFPLSSMNSGTADNKYESTQMNTIQSMNPNQNKVKNSQSLVDITAPIHHDIQPVNNSSSNQNNTLLTHSQVSPVAPILKADTLIEQHTVHSPSNLSQKNKDSSPTETLSEPSSQDILKAIQTQIQKMALKEDLLELKRTLDMMEQQRNLDREDLMSRVMEQKIVEKEIFEQINSTKQRLEDAISRNLIDSKSVENNKLEKDSAVRPPSELKPIVSKSTPTAKEKIKTSPTELQQPGPEGSGRYQRSRKTSTSSQKNNYSLEERQFSDYRKSAPMDYYDSGFHFPPPTDRYPPYLSRKGSRQFYDYGSHDTFRFNAPQDQPKRPTRRQRSHSAEFQQTSTDAVGYPNTPNISTRVNSRKSSLRSAKSFQSEEGLLQAEKQSNQYYGEEGDDYFTTGDMINDTNSSTFNENRHYRSLPTGARSIKKNSLKYRQEGSRKPSLENMESLPPSMFYHHATFMNLPPPPHFDPTDGQSASGACYGYLPDYFAYNTQPNRRPPTTRRYPNEPIWTHAELVPPPLLPHSRIQRRAENWNMYDGVLPTEEDEDMENMSKHGPLQDEFSHQPPMNGYIPIAAMRRHPGQRYPPNFP